MLPLPSYMYNKNASCACFEVLGLYKRTTEHLGSAFKLEY